MLKKYFLAQGGRVGVLETSVPSKAAYEDDSVQFHLRVDALVSFNSINWAELEVSLEVAAVEDHSVSGDTGAWAYVQKQMKALDKLIDDVHMELMIYREYEYPDIYVGMDDIILITVLQRGYESAFRVQMTKLQNEVVGALGTHYLDVFQKKLDGMEKLFTTNIRDHNLKNYLHELNKFGHQIVQNLPLVCLISYYLCEPYV